MKTNVKFASIAGMIILAVIFASCEKNVPAVDGHVYYAGTRIAVAGATVDIDGITCTSCSQGRFSVLDLINGEHTLKVEKEGFDPYIKSFILDGDNITFEIPMRSEIYTSKVTGKIMGEKNRSAKNDLNVVLINPDRTCSKCCTLSDGDGTYQLFNIPFGLRTLQVKRSDYTVKEIQVVVEENELVLDLKIPEPVTFTDQRDGNSYRAIQIGDQTWMLDNLAFLPSVGPTGDEPAFDENHFVYGYQGNDPQKAKTNPNYDKYGVLYNLPAALSACPDGWHLPTDEEWIMLETTLGMSPQDAGNEFWRPTGAVGLKLKSCDEMKGNDCAEFSALPSGFVNNNFEFAGIGYHTSFWTSTEEGYYEAWARSLEADNKGINREKQAKRVAISVRCVKD